MATLPRPVTVIVLSWNGLDVTRACVSSLLGRTNHPAMRVIAVDNASTDGTAEYLRGVEGITVIENDENVGFVKGNNAGIRACDTDVVLLNNDTEIIQDDWLERMQETAWSAPDIGVVGCRLVNSEGRLVHAGTYMPVPSFWGQEYPGDEKDIGQYPDDAEVEGVIFACAYIRRELIDTIGPLDEDYFSYFEDTDYCMKTRQAGYRVFRCGAATVKHLENASTDLNRMDFSGTFRRSREVFLSKWKDAVEARYTRKLTWHSFISGEDAWSRAGSSVLRALDRAGVDVNLGFLEGAGKAELVDFLVNEMKNRGADRERLQVLFGPPEAVGLADGARNIAYTNTPYDRFKPEWIKELNRLEELWVPDEFQRAAALESGFRGEPRVMPPGVDPAYFHPGIRGNPLEGRFTFLADLDWGPGAAWETLIRAFTEEFSRQERAVLVMKVASPAPGAEVEEAVEALALPFERAPVVFVMDHDVPGYQKGCLYRSVDCLVVPGRSPGAGGAALEALACGVPAIVPAWGAGLTLPGADAVIAVKCGRVESPEPGFAWADPDRDDMRSAMRRMYESAGDFRAAALAASAVVRDEYSWDRLASAMVARLESIEPAG